MEDGLRMVGVGVCGAWPLPEDPTCAGLARRTYRGVAESLSLDPPLVDDGVTIVSELAANTLHVQGDCPRGGPELWLYLRGTGPRRELVCKVFDAYPGWLGGPPFGGAVTGHSSRVPADAVGGRGLEVVHELSGGRWGYHLTRSRLGDDLSVRGKAVWFAVPVPAANAMNLPALGLPGNAGSAAEAMTELETALSARGFGGSLVRADDSAADMAVLSVCGGITVWCRAGVAWLRAPGMSGQRRSYSDLAEVAEQAVEACETMATDSGEQARVPELAGVSRGGVPPESASQDGAFQASVSRLGASRVSV
ncbi:MAG TPA: hypothetical protein VGG75_02970 [Trebonia sp.]|jgi:hypothetical protein